MQNLWIMLLLAACSSDAAPGGTAAEAGHCADSQDNDDDGFTDCADQDCWGDAACVDAGREADVTVTDAAPDTPAPEDTPAPQDTPAPEDVPDTPPPTPDTSGPSQPCQPCGTGSLTGKVCAPNEQVFVNDATITIEVINCDGQPETLTATSDPNGNYHFDAVPCGTHTVNVDKGSFHNDYGATITTGEHTDLSGAATKLCFQATSTTIAVLTGNYDNIEGLLTKLGLEFDLYSVDGAVGVGTIVELLSDPTSLSQYEIIFANCGGYHGWMPIDFPDVMPNVKQYVLNGGSLYMSDYAWVYGEWAFPDAIEFMGSDDVNDMFSEKSPQLITGGQTFTGNIADGSLGAYLGKTTLSVTFDQGPQIAPEAAGDGTFPHVSAKVSQFTPALNATIPLVLSYTPAAGAGRVVYTNFHNDAQATDDMLKVLQHLVFTL